MNLKLHTALLASILVIPAFAAAKPDPSLLLWLPLDQPTDDLVEDRSSNALEGESVNVRWATGSFGTAAQFGGTNAFIDLPAVPSLNGATQCTISVWATWEGTGRYPNLLTTHTWSPGGLMLFVRDNTCSFRLGRPGHRAGAPGSEWKETGAPLLNALPRQEWVHLAVVFSLPNITTFVNGKAVGKETWPYPVEADGLRIGAWTGPVSHQGLISDLRIYGRALAPEEISALADDPRRVSADYTLLDTSAIAAPLVKSFENRHVTLSVDAQGRIVSLRNKASHRELLARPQALVSARLKDGHLHTARKASFHDGALTFEFPRGAGTAVLGVDTRDDLFTFTVRSLSLTNVATLTFLNLPVTPTQYAGGMANMLSDDTDAVCLRGYELPVEMSMGGTPPALKVWTTAEHGLTGWRAGLAAGPKSEMPAMLRAMAVEAGVPISKLGGPWALEAEANRGSYLFADLSLASVDDWIELARRGGFTHIHIHGWWATLGHYGVNTNLFPNGLADLKATVDRIHAAGLKAGIHTLTACIDPRDSWVTPVPSPQLIAAATYTLAQPVSTNDTVIYVNEKPWPGHDVVFTYAGSGNVLRLGTELVQYSEISADPPYRFANCKRGAFNTRPGSHAAGERADYLQQRYLAFYPEPGSLLAEELADRIANVFNSCRLDQIYFDGSEGMRSRYGVDFMRHAIFKRLRGEVLVEASEWGAHNWWFHSRLGAWDHSVWAAKRFHDRHMASAARFRNSDLLGPQMGWWAPRRPTAHARGHFLDEMEYFAAKNFGMDAAMSIQGVNVSSSPLEFHIEKQMTVLGWYEQLRRARYFNKETVARVGVPGEEFRLRQSAGGTWEFTPVNMSTHRVSALGNGTERWTSQNPFAAQPVTARIEALHAVEAYEDPKHIRVTDSGDLANFHTAASAAAVSLRLEEAAGETPGDRGNLRILAENQGTTRRGAWAQASLLYARPYRDLSGTGALGVWVKGDGKGALLNIQLATPREYMSTRSDHYIKIDFTGWRYVELLLRERDVAEMDHYVWPYGDDYTLFRTALDMAHISEVNLYLNNLPAGESTEIVLSPIHALPVRATELKNPSLTLHGQTVTLPVRLKSGDFIEMDSPNACAHYNDRGDLLAWIRPVAKPDWPMLQPGDNPFTFDCEKPAEVSARAEVAITAFGTPFGTPNLPANVDWNCLMREYDMPRWLTANASATTWELFVRPGEVARLELELAGTMDSPALSIGGREYRFPVKLKAGDRLRCRDQRRWTVHDAKRAQIAEGELDAPLPTLQGGATRVSFTCDAPDRALVKLIKVYTPAAK